MVQTLKSFAARAFRVIGLVLFSGWWILQSVLNWIGRSTVPEDSKVATDRASQILDWVLSTPGWVPATLATAFALVVLFPGAFAFAFKAMRGKVPRGPTINTTPQTQPIEISKQVAPTMAAPIGGLLSAPLASMPRPTPPSPPHFWWKELPSVDEGADKNAAKKKIVQLARRFLDKALFQQLHFYAAARDAFTAQFANSPLRNALVRGLDIARDGESRAIKGALADLLNPDAVAVMSLHEATSNYYGYFCNYVRGIQLTADLIKKASFPGAVPENIRTKHDAWRLVHDEMMAEHKRLANEDLYLDLLRTMSEQPTLAIPEFDWGPKANP
jgi:hypothetical protein